MDSKKENQQNHGEPNGGSTKPTSNSAKEQGFSNGRPRTMRSQSEELGNGDGRSARRKSSGGRSRKGVTFSSNKCQGNSNYKPATADYGAPTTAILGNGPLCLDTAGHTGIGFDGLLSSMESGGTDEDTFRRKFGVNREDICLPSSAATRHDGQNWINNTEAQPSIEKCEGKTQKQRKIGFIDTPRGPQFRADHYNDFVNELYTESNSNEPLLSKQSREAKPSVVKSIVKSTSAVNVQGLRGEDQHGEKNACLTNKPRLSLQAPTSGVGADNQIVYGPMGGKPHVQFKADMRWPSENRAGEAQFNSGMSADGKSNSFESFTGSEGSSSSSSSGSSSSSSSSEENSSMDRFAEARPPDGGWGWMVVFAAFMVNLFSDGVTFSFGVLYVEFLDYFGEGKAKTAWIASLFMSMPLLSGPIASFLTDRYGCRKVTVVGSIMASTGFILSAFTDSIEMLYFTFGILSGFGLSLCYVAAVVIVAYYFEKRRSFATGLSLCGSGIGTFIFAPLTQLLIEEYGWRGSILILGGIFLNMGVCGLLMRDLEWTSLRRKKINDQRKEEKAQKKANRRTDKRAGGSSRNTASDTLSISTNTAMVAGGESTEVCLEWPERKNSIGGGDGDEEDGDPRLFSSLIVLPTFLKDGEKVPHEVLESLSTNRHILMMNNYATMPIPSFRDGSQKTPTEETAAAGVTPTTVSSASGPAGCGSAANGDVKKSLVATTDNERVLMSIIERNQRRRPHKDHRNRSMTMTTTTKPNTAYLNDMRIHRHSLTYRGAMLNINRYRLRASSCPDIYRNSMTTIAKEKSQLRQGIEEFRNLFWNILDFSHFSDIRFVLFAISNFLLYAWYDVPYVYIADYAISFGVNQKMASILLSIVGIINMVGEVSPDGWECWAVDGHF